METANTTPEVEGGRPRVIVTLVHGTFARNAAWVKDGSPLRQALRDRLAGADVEFAPFVWSGRNSHRARVEAGLRLRRFLVEQSRRLPEARRFVVAHSHGGNVSLYGLRRLRAHHQVQGVACLGTPFVHAMPGDLTEIARRWKRRFTMLALLVIVCYVTSYSDLFTMYSGGSTGRLNSLAAVLAIPIILAALASRYIFGPAGPAVRRWTRTQARLCRRLQPPLKLLVPFLCVGARRDEAKFALDVTDATAKMGGGAINLLTKVVSVLTAFAAVLSLLLIGLGGWLIYRGVRGHHSSEEMSSMQYLILGFVLVLFMLPLLAGSLLSFFASRLAASTVAVALQSAVKSVAYGRLGAGSNSLLAVTQRSFPPGDVAYDVELFDIRKPFFSSGLGLRHSMLYTSSDILNVVAAWMLSRGGVVVSDRDECRESPAGSGGPRGPEDRSTSGPDGRDGEEFGLTNERIGAGAPTPRGRDHSIPSNESR